MKTMNVAVSAKQRDVASWIALKIRKKNHFSSSFAAKNDNFLVKCPN